MADRDRGSLRFAQTPPEKELKERESLNWEDYRKKILDAFPERDRKKFTEIVEKYSTEAISYAIFRMKFNDMLNKLINEESDKRRKKELINKLKIADKSIRELDNRLIEFKKKYDDTNLPDRFKDPRIGQIFSEIEKAKLAVIVGVFVYDESAFNNEIAKKINDGEKINLRHILGRDLYASTSYKTTIDKYIFDIYDQIKSKKDKDRSADEKSIMSLSVEIGNPEVEKGLESLKLWGFTTYPDQVQEFKNLEEFRQAIAKEWGLEKGTDDEIKKKLFDFLITVAKKGKIYFYIDPGKNVYVNQNGKPNKFGEWYIIVRKSNLDRTIELIEKTFGYLKGKMTREQLINTLPQLVQVATTTFNSINHALIFPATRIGGEGGGEALILASTKVEGLYDKIFEKVIKGSYDEASKVNTSFFAPIVMCKLNAITGYTENRESVIREYEKRGIKVNFTIDNKEFFPSFVPDNGMVLVRVDKKSSLAEVIRREKIDLNLIKESFEELDIGKYTTFIGSISVNVHTNQVFDKYPLLTFTLDKEEKWINATANEEASQFNGKYPPIADIYAVSGYDPKLLNFISLQPLEKYKLFRPIAHKIIVDRKPINIYEKTQEIKLTLPTGFPPIAGARLRPDSNLNCKVNIEDDVPYPYYEKPVYFKALPEIKGEYKVLLAKLDLPSLHLSKEAKDTYNKIMALQSAERTIENIYALGELTSQFLNQLSPEDRKRVEPLLSPVIQTSVSDLNINSFHFGVSKLFGAVDILFMGSISGKSKLKIEEPVSMKVEYTIPGVGTTTQGGYYIESNVLEKAGYEVKINGRDYYINPDDLTLREGSKDGRIVEDFKVVRSEYGYGVNKKASETIEETYSGGIVVSYDKLGKMSFVVDPKLKQYILNLKFYEDSFDEIYKSEKPFALKLLGTVVNDTIVSRTEYPGGRYYSFIQVSPVSFQQNIKFLHKDVDIGINLLPFKLEYIEDVEGRKKIDFKGFPEFSVNALLFEKVNLTYITNEYGERYGIFANLQPTVKGTPIKLSAGVLYDPKYNNLYYSCGINIELGKKKKLGEKSRAKK